MTQSADNPLEEIPSEQSEKETSEVTDSVESQNQGEETADGLEAKQADPVQEALTQFAVSWKNTSGEAEEGPLEVLWDLIESYKVDIFDVSLMTITEDFLHFLETAKELQIELASSFAVMASRLLFYKSKALLPDPGFEDSDEEPGLPPELVQQLLEYRKFQQAADRLRNREDIASGILPREKIVIPEQITGDSEWLDVNLVDLISAYSRLLQKLDKENQVEESYDIELEEFSVDEKMTALRNLLESRQYFGFYELFQNKKSFNRGELIATFLALLEITKLGEIIIRQKSNFGEIRIFKKTVTIT